MYSIGRVFGAALLTAGLLAQAAGIAPKKTPLLKPTGSGEGMYYWTSSPVANTAQLLTLFCQNCIATADGREDLPLVSLLRDTLGDSSPENDRIMYVWLLSSNRLGIGQKILSAVPFFYWRVGDGSTSVSSRDLVPLLNLNQSQHNMMSEMRRNIVQWTALDPLTREVRASSRSFWANQIDYERLHIEAAIGHLRQAPVFDNSDSLNARELNTVIARLELRKSMLGGLADDSHATRFGEETSFTGERVRSRNWEALRQFAEKTGLYFEPITLAGVKDEHAILWFPVDGTLPSNGTSLNSIWKILNIKNPWTDKKLLSHQEALSYNRFLDEDGMLLPNGEIHGKPVRLVPLSVYSLNYSRQPLLLVDFRDKLSVRRHEMTQRTITEITAGVIGISRLTNWYYYAGAMAYNMIWARHGIAVDQAARLDCYSQFRMELALDQQLDPTLRQSLQKYAESLAVNPLAASANRELAVASAHLTQLQGETGEHGKLVNRLQEDRRAELADFGESMRVTMLHSALHIGALGLYTHRVAPEQATFAFLDKERRIRYHLEFLDSVVNNGTEPEVAFNPSQIQTSVTALRNLLPDLHSSPVKAHAINTLGKLKSLSRDEILQADCALGIIEFRKEKDMDLASRPLSGAAVAGSVRATSKGTTLLPR